MSAALNFNKGLVEVIDEIIACAPDLAGGLASLRSSVEVSSPEMLPFYWGEFAMTLSFIGSSHSKRAEFRRIITGHMIPKPVEVGPRTLH